MHEIIFLGCAMLLTGVVAGIMAGLLGVGGGLVIVPMLEFALGFMGVDASIRMQIAVATSLATIIPTSIASSRAHFKKNSVDLPLAKKWTPWILAGSLAGAWVASQVHSNVLSAVFAVVTLLVAVKLILPLDEKTLTRRLPKHPAIYSAPTLIGFISTLMGIGGGSLSVPVLTFFGESVHRAVGTAALFGFIIAVPGTLGFIYTGLDNPLLPIGSAGFVSLIGFALLAPTTTLTAPLGARLAHKMEKRHLTLLFGVFLLVVSVRMFTQTFES
ncbi:MAG TPA: sulfite exporter TauE/SafE family protein [Xanthomonadales bacterium]|nr:sulfite exporter TauE/SafE family protein [Xanthomonadales bacterium]